MILTTTSFHDINQKILTKKKGLFPKFQLILSLRLQLIILCALALLHRLLFNKFSDTRILAKMAIIS